MFIHFSQDYQHKQEKILQAVQDFDSKGEIIQSARNVVKWIEVNGEKFNFKRFARPNIINRFAYRYVRKSKAERSFLYAQRLLEIGFNTPKPVAFLEERGLGLGFSFYISEQVEYDYTIRDLVLRDDIPDEINILNQYIEFHYRLHEANILFLDNSLGNTLITAQGDSYSCTIVDINRLRFNQKLNFQQRMKNFERLSCSFELTEQLATRYAQLANYNTQMTIDTMWKYIEHFQRTYFKNRERKQKLKRLIGIN